MCVTLQISACIYEVSDKVLFFEDQIITLNGAIRKSGCFLFFSVLFCCTDERKYFPAVVHPTSLLTNTENFTDCNYFYYFSVCSGVGTSPTTLNFM